MSPDQYNKLKRHIVSTGYYPSLLVVKRGDNYVLVDGHNRFNVCKELEFKEVWCEVWEMDEKHADLLLATINRLKGTDDTQKRIKLISHLYEEFGEDKEELLKLLPETDKSLNLMLKMASGDLEKDFANLDEGDDLGLDIEEKEDLDKEYNEKEGGKMTLTFVFDNEEEYIKVSKYFGWKRPSCRKLLALLSGELYV